MEKTKINRVEYIDKNGRKVIHSIDQGNVYTDIQDDGKTLKIFNEDWFVNEEYQKRVKTEKIKCNYKDCDTKASIFDGKDYCGWHYHKLEKEKINAIIQNAIEIGDEESIKKVKELCKKLKSEGETIKVEYILNMIGSKQTIGAADIENMKGVNKNEKK